MKEAAGEANMTVITIVLIGVVMLIGGLIVNGVMNSTRAKACCTSVGGTMSGGVCSLADNADYKACVDNDLECPEGQKEENGSCVPE